jgi:hypothetical protein
MPRRRESFAWGMRRDARVRGKGSPSLTFESVFGALLADIVYAGDSSLVSGEVGSVTSRIRSIALTPTGGAGARPFYTAVNAFVGGQPTIDCQLTGARSLQSGVISPAEVAAGNRPMLIIVGRVHTANATAMSLGCIRDSSPAFDVGLRTVVTTDWNARYFSGVTYQSTRATQDTSPHIMGCLLDGTAGSSLWLDGGTYSTQAGGTSAFGGNGANLWFIGCSAGGEPANYSCAVSMILSNTPTPAQLAGAYQVAQRYYGVA